jgi:hypothetical protein
MSPTEVAVEFVAVDATRGLGDVGAQVGRTLDIGDDLDRGDELAQVARDGLLQCDQAKTGFLELSRPTVVLVVAEHEVLGAFEVGRQQDLRRPRDELGDPRRQSGDAVADLVELLVELVAQFLGHQPKPSCDVALGSLVRRVREDLLGLVELHQHTRYAYPTAR